MEVLVMGFGCAGWMTALVGGVAVGDFLTLTFNDVSFKGPPPRN
jgi:hypothetical protein